MIATFADAPFEVIRGLKCRTVLAEHRTALPGRGHDSQTDALVFASGDEGNEGLVVIAVEGKAGERFDLPVTEWLGDASENRRARLNGVCAHLGLEPDDVGGLEWQLLHRAAAAVIEAKRFGATNAMLLVHCFAPESPGLAEYREFIRTFENSADAAAGDVVALGSRGGIDLYAAWIADESKPAGHGAMRSDIDSAMEELTRVVASELDALARLGVELGEKAQLEPLVHARLLSGSLGALDEAGRWPKLPNWTGKLGPFDAVVRHSDGRHGILVELKLRQTYWMLWDAYKLTDGLELDGAEAAYMIVGAAEKAWNAEYANCEHRSRTTELFGEGTVEHDSADLFQRNAHAWFDLLTGGSARPTRVPARIRTTLIAKAPMWIDGAEGSLRCVRVEAIDDGWLDFPEDNHNGDWPGGVSPCQHYFDWREKLEESDA